MENTKERILNVSINLFAKYGYSGTGVRKIANEADVNISMINYYFKSKSGILKEIVESFISKVTNRLFEEKIDKLSLNPEKKIRKIIKILVEIIRKNHNHFLVTFLELPFELQDLAQWKSQKIREIIPLIYGENIVKMITNKTVVNKLNIRPDIIGPMIASMVFSHFIFKPIIVYQGLGDYDDEFYEMYPDYIVDILLNGLKSKINLKEIFSK